MTTRRGFLGAVLAAGLAPAFIKSGIARGILMPTRQIELATDEEILEVGGVLPLRGEIGRYEGVRVLRSVQRQASLAARRTLDEVQLTSDLPGGYMMVARMLATMGSAPTESEPLVLIAHPAWEPDLRQEPGFVPVDQYRKRG